MTKNAQYTREWLDIMENLDGDIAGRAAAHAYMETSTALVHYIHAESSFLPRLFDHETYNKMKWLAETAHRVCEKVMRRYLDDPSYRELFDYDERLRELILIPQRYDALLPFARFDVFLNENTLTGGFCEWNADGSSGMNEDRELNISIKQSKTYELFATHHDMKTSDLFNPWVEEFIKIYNTFENRVERPTFAIVDFMENAVVDEFKVYARYFGEHGYPCLVEDVRDLVYDAEKRELRDKKGRKIDAIWRRSVTNDILNNWEESQPMISAVRDGAVALIGSFAGHIVHDKQIFDAVFWPETREMLTMEEKTFVDEWVPQTKFLDDEHIDLDEVRKNKNNWIIKPTDQYGAHDVYAGSMHSQEEWEDIVDRFANGKAGAPFLVQTYLTPFRTELLPIENDLLVKDDAEIPRETVHYNNMPGLYSFNGTFGGVFARLGPKPIISQPMGDLTSAVMWVDCGTFGKTKKRSLPRRIWNIFTKILSIIGILAIVTMLLTFGFWTWDSSVDWVAWAQVKDAIQPLIDFMQPFMDFYGVLYIRLARFLNGDPSINYAG